MQVLVFHKREEVRATNYFGASAGADSGCRRALLNSKFLGISLFFPRVSQPLFGMLKATSINAELDLTFAYFLIQLLRITCSNT